MMMTVNQSVRGCFFVVLCVIMLASSADALTKSEFALVFITRPDGNVNHGVATSQDLRTDISPSGTDFHRQFDGSQSITWISETVSVDNTTGTWSEIGNLTFPSGDVLRFQSVGHGHSFNGPNTGDGYGGIAYVIEGGTGKLANAKGVMVDTFLALNNQPTFVINAWGFFWV